MRKRERKAVVEDLRAGAKTMKTWPGGACLSLARRDSCTCFDDLFRRDAQRLKNHDQAFWAREFTESSLKSEVISRRVMLLLFCAELIERGDWG